MEPSGRTTAWLQGDDGSLEDVGQVKVSDDLDRANMQFADVDGKRDTLPTIAFSNSLLRIDSVRYIVY